MHITKTVKAKIRTNVKAKIHTNVKTIETWAGRRDN